MSNSKASKILGLFLILSFLFLVFLARIADIATSDRFAPMPLKKEIDSPTRGEIVSADNFHAARSMKTYSVSVNPANIAPEKLDLFVKMFSIYSQQNDKSLKAVLQGEKKVILQDGVDARTAKNYRQLSTTLDKMKVFIPKKIGSRYYRFGLEISENSFLREYPFGDLFQPYLGFVKYETGHGLIGVENFYENILTPSVHGYISGQKDVGGNIIFNKKSENLSRQDGSNIKLSVNFKLQKSVELILDGAKRKLGAQEIIAAVMEPHTGRFLSIASSNRFVPYQITKESLSSMKVGAVQYIYEPGSTIKPFVFAMLLEKRLTSQFEMVNGHGGKYQIGNKLITDEHKAMSMTAEDGIIYSSNIAMAQLAQRLDPKSYAEGLRSFGFGVKSGIELGYELPGDLPSVMQLQSDIYKATASYGYGMRTNFPQLMAAYNIFNNGGKFVTPRLVQKVYYGANEKELPPQERACMLSESTVQKMKGILRKVVEKGTGVDAKVPGLDIGGKTGTAHIAKGGSYVRSFNSSFFGFANDDKNRYTIGVLVVEPQGAHFASVTAVPVFKNIVLKMADLGYLVPKGQPLTIDSNITH